MLGKILFLDYSDLGSSESLLFYHIATDKMRIDFQRTDDNRISDIDGSKSLELTYFDVIEGLEKKAILKDEIYFKEDYDILHAERELVNTKGQKITSEQVPTGVFVYNYDDVKEWKEEEGKEEWIQSDSIRMELVKQTNKVIAEFKERFDETLKRRAARVSELYSINPERFFNNDHKDGIGAIFTERFFVCSMGPSPKASFHLESQTDNYKLMFDYEKDSPFHHHWGWLAGTLYILRGNHGFNVSFDEDFNIRRVTETGAPNVAIDKMYIEKDLIKGTGKIIHDNIMKIWEEVRMEFNIDERIEMCEGLTPQEVSKAEKIVTYMCNKGKFPFLKSKKNHK